MSKAAERRQEVFRLEQQLREDYFRYGAVVTVHEVRLERKRSRIFIYGVSNQSLRLPAGRCESAVVLIRPGIIDVSPSVGEMLGYRVSKYGGITGGTTDVRSVFQHLAQRLWPHQPRVETLEQPDGRRVELFHGLQYAEMTETWVG